MLVTQNKGQECWTYRQRWCDAVVDVRSVCQRFWRLSVRWAGWANIYMGLEGFS